MKEKQLDKVITEKRLEDRVSDVEITLKRIENKLQVSGAESSKVFNEVREKFRLMGQEIAHLNSITFPAYWEQEIKEIKDVMYNANAKIDEEVARWKHFRETRYFEAVTEIEALNLVKISGTTLKELVPVLGMEMSAISRMMNGERKNENPAACHKIKQFCLDKMSKNK